MVRQHEKDIISVIILYKIFEISDRAFAFPECYFTNYVLIYRNLIQAYRRNAANKKGHSTEVKVLVCLRYLGTARALDDLDDGARLSTESARKYIKHFATDLVRLHGPQYFNRYPNKSELQAIADRYESLGFPGCIGAVDCCNIIWKNYPIEEKGQYHNPKDSKLAVVKVKAWCDDDLYIWHWFAGRPGTTNDKTMLAFSPLFQSVFNGTYSFYLSRAYRVLPNGMERLLAYLLADGIYPRWPIFMLPIHETEDRKELLYTRKQEGRRKDIERAFGALQARFKVLRYEDHRWYKGDIVECSHACKILHKMLVRMNQAGCVTQDIQEEHGELDIINDMHQPEEDLSRQRDEEREQAEHTAADADAGMDDEEQVEDMFFREATLTSYELHVSLKKDLMDMFASRSQVYDSSREAFGAWLYDVGACDVMWDREC